MSVEAVINILMSVAVGLVGGLLVGASTDLFLHGNTVISDVGLKAAVIGFWTTAIITFIFTQRNS